MPESTTATVTDGETPEVTAPTTETVTPGTPGETPETPTEPTTPASTEDAAALKAEVARLQAQLKKTNAEAATHRHEAKELKAFKEQTEAASLSEKEKLEAALSKTQAALTASEQRAQAYKVATEVRLHARDLQFAHPDIAGRLLDQTQLAYDDDGTPTNVRDLLEALLKDMPELKVTPPRPAASTSGGATNPPRSVSTAVPISWDYIGKLTPAEYEARRLDIAAFMNDPKNHRTRR